MADIIYNPTINKFPSGPLKINEEVVFYLKVQDKYFLNKVILVLRYEKTNDTRYIEGILNNKENNYNVYKFSAKLDIAGLYWYHFDLYTDNGVLYVNKNNRYLGCFNGNEEFPLTVVKKDIPTNIRFQGGIIYQIFVDRFCKVGDPILRDGFIYRDDWGGKITKNTDDRTRLNYEVFGGNLKGVISKLDYLKSIGVTTIYLSPIFMAPSNHKYDTSDYSKIDPMYGEQKTLLELIIQAEDRGMGIILDGVFNHIGSDSVYFNKEKHFDTIGAYNSKESPYYEWFDFQNWPDEYRCWWGIKTLPSVNQANKNLQEYISSIIKRYMLMGLQGFRLDVVDEIHHEMLTNICDSVYKVKKDALIIGEVWEDASTKIAYGNRRGYFLGEELNSVMNYPLKEALLKYVMDKDCDNFVYTYHMIEDNYPEFVKHNLMNLIGSHDTKRVISILKQKEDYEKLYKIITGLQFTFYGVPSIFYGDEVGLEQDPPDFSRKCYPWGDENKEILEWYKILSKIRKHKVFKNGKMNLIKSDSGILVFNRKDLKEEILIISNLNDKKYIYDDGNKYKSLINNKVIESIEVERNDIDILIKIN